MRAIAPEAAGESEPASAVERSENVARSENGQTVAPARTTTEGR